MLPARQIRCGRTRRALSANWYEHSNRAEGFDSIHQARNTHSPGQRVPDSPQDIFDIPGSPSRTIFERTSRWRIRVDAAPPLQFRATIVLTPRLLASEELWRLTRLLGARAEQAVHRPDEPGALPAPIERWRCSPSKAASPVQQDRPRRV